MKKQKSVRILVLVVVMIIFLYQNVWQHPPAFESSLENRALAHAEKLGVESGEIRLRVEKNGMRAYGISDGAHFCVIGYGQVLSLSLYTRDKRSSTRAFAYEDRSEANVFYGDGVYTAAVKEGEADYELKIRVSEDLREMTLESCIVPPQRWGIRKGPFLAGALVIILVVGWLVRRGEAAEAKEAEQKKE